MEPIELGALPDEILQWRGTAAELAEQCNKLLPAIGLPGEAGTANERLVRHYVQVGILTPPEREGREALFGARQVAEFLAARHLIHDGWSLSKIAELIKSAGPEGLTRLMPAPRPPTPAEEALARLKSAASPRPAARAPRVADEPGVLQELVPPKWSDPDESLASDPLRQAHEISRRRMDLRKTLTDLGNKSGAPERRRTIRISLTPWCHVYVDARQLTQLSSDAPEILGNALTQALHEERIRKGEKS